MVNVKILGPVQNGARIYASLEHPGVAIPETRVNSAVSKEVFLLGQSLQSVEGGADELHLAQCFISILLSITSDHVTQAVSELRDGVKEDVKTEVKQIKRRCLSGMDPAQPTRSRETTATLGLTNQLKSCTNLYRPLSCLGTWNKAVGPSVSILVVFL